MIIVIPLAGRGSRLSQAGFETPKPFIDVSGRPMLARAFQSVANLAYTRVVFIALAEHVRRYQLARLASSWAGDRAHVIQISEVTDGQLCTVLMAREFFDTEEDLLISSADTFVASDISLAIAERAADCRGIVSVARLPGNNWSFVEVDEDGCVTRVAEKERISSLASTGLYYFSSAREFTVAAESIIADGRKTRNEYYVIPVYQRYLDEGARVEISEALEVWDMGNPTALKEFEAHLVARS